MIWLACSMVLSAGAWKLRGMKYFEGHHHLLRRRPPIRFLITLVKKNVVRGKRNASHTQQRMIAMKAAISHNSLKAKPPANRNRTKSHGAVDLKR